MTDKDSVSNKDDKSHSPTLSCFQEKIFEVLVSFDAKEWLEIDLKQFVCGSRVGTSKRINGARWD